MNFKKLYTILLTATALMWGGCSEDDFSKDYDIEFPVATITEASDLIPFVDDEIILKGENLQTATIVGIGAYRFEVLSVADNGASMQVKVPRSVKAGILSVINKYGRVAESEVKISPQFYPAVVTGWPTQIQKDRTFTIEGENMDLLEEVKLNGTVLTIAGTATPESATYSSKGAEVSIGDEVILEVTPKNGEKQERGGIKIIKAVDTYVPKQTLMLIDINADYVVANGDAFGQCQAAEDAGLLGNAYRVTAPKGNGWNGIYCQIFADNNGNGYDLSAYTNPCITMLINTNGKQGYAQPLINNNDYHLDGKFGYGDDYKSTTNGWEWRSYPLSELDKDLNLSSIERIGVGIRGGNVGNDNDEAFDISVNMVMITDGPLNPTVLWDCETPVDAMGKFVLKNTGDGGLQGVSEGAKFASYTKSITGSWDWDTDCEMGTNGLDEQLYTNGLWMNLLINTGNNVGYFQFEVGQDGNKLDWLNFTPDQGYGDDYALVPTNNQWVWRSFRVDADGMGLNIANPFYFKVGATTGNWESGVYELNFDYVVFTAAPMDPTLNTNDFK